MMPVIQRHVHALYRCFTHRHRTIVISPTEGTVFHPLKRDVPVDGHGVSPTFSCGWARCFTHRRHGVSPTGTHRKLNNGAGLQKRNARAFFNFKKSFYRLWRWKTQQRKKEGSPACRLRRRAQTSPAGSLPLPLSEPSARRIDPLWGRCPPLPAASAPPLFLFSDEGASRNGPESVFDGPR